jgi:hypothetical protein
MLPEQDNLARSLTSGQGMRGGRKSRRTRHKISRRMKLPSFYPKTPDFSMTV